MYCVIKCVKTTRVLKDNFASTVFHSFNAKTQICVTGPQCVKEYSSMNKCYIRGLLCGHYNWGLNLWGQELGKGTWCGKQRGVVLVKGQTAHTMQLYSHTNCSYYAAIQPHKQLILCSYTATLTAHTMQLYIHTNCSYYAAILPH
jgi:hypothetical protein